MDQVIKGSFQTFVKLDEALRQTLSIAGDSQERFDGLSKSIAKIASTSVFTAEEIANASTELARAGLNVDQIIEALPGISDAAAAYAPRACRGSRSAARCGSRRR